MSQTINKAVDLVSLNEAGELFGCTSAALRKCLKKGLPFTKRLQENGRTYYMISIKATKEWGIVNHCRLFKKIPEDRVIPPPAPPEVKSPEPIQLGLASSLDFIRKAEYRARIDYADALKSKDRVRIQIAQKAHIDSHKQLEAAEKHIEHIKEAQQEAWDEVKKAISQWADPIREFLETLPQSIAGRLNAADPQTAENVLRSAIDTQLLPLMSRKPRIHQ
jgi:hypothetical protein